MKKYLYDEIIINSQNIYLPERALSLDECIIKYTGRCNFNVVIPQNPTRKGLKIYMLSESKIGFILNWLLYSGKNENNNLSNIICKLCMNYEGENFCLYIDRYYNSINDLINIKKYNIYEIGTILKNRIWKNDEISKDIKLLKRI